MSTFGPDSIACGYACADAQDSQSGLDFAFQGQQLPTHIYVIFE